MTPLMTAIFPHPDIAHSSTSSTGSRSKKKERAGSTTSTACTSSTKVDFHRFLLGHPRSRTSTVDPLPKSDTSDGAYHLGGVGLDEKAFWAARRVKTKRAATLA